MRQLFERVRHFPLTYEYTDGVADATDGTSFSFAGTNIGTAHRERWVLAAICYRDAVTSGPVDPTGVQIAGVEATFLASADSAQLSGYNAIHYYIAHVPQGTTATLSVTLDGTVARLGIGVYAIYSPTQPVAIYDSASSTNLTSPDLAVSTRRGQAAFAATIGNNSFNEMWFGLRLDERILLEGDVYAVFASYPVYTEMDPKPIDAAITGSPDRGVSLAIVLEGKHPVPDATVVNVEFVVGSVSNSGTIDVPAEAQAGDLLVLCDVANNTSAVPPLVTPSGFTNQFNIPGSAQTRMAVSTKISNGTETTLTGMTGNSTIGKVLTVFRANKTISSITLNDTDSQATTGDPTAQTIISGSGGTPSLALGFYGSTGAMSSQSFSPAEDGQLGGNSRAITAWRAFQDSPVNETIDLGDHGINTLASCYITFT